mmetsp:Transcript_43292/g.92663  ORF Transcript_43292/g.92663 Transcript_43292/m.92663 type:complete len:179 (+) Transcript_43292:148-684(+)
MGQQALCCESCAAVISGRDSRNLPKFAAACSSSTSAPSPATFGGYSYDDEETFRQVATRDLPLSPVAGGHLFRVRLQKKRGEKLGLNVEHIENSQTLPVIGVKPGIVEMWNQRAGAELSVKPGDEVVEVNGVRGSADRMLEQCQHQSTLELYIFRSSHKDSACSDPCRRHEACKCFPG